MGFSSRLQRFAQAKEGAKLEADRGVEADESVRDDVDESRVAAAVEPPDKQAQLLADLRARMAKALAKHDAKRERTRTARGEEGGDEPERMPCREALPFERIETASGTFERRLRTESPFVRVGGVVLSDAREASFPWLGVLALDETIAACTLEGALFLDTETTGLAGGTGTLAFLVGLAWWSAEEERFVTELLFLPNFASEEAMLEHLDARLRQAKCLVTFNGKSFDVPLLKTRFALHRRAFPFDGPHLDLLHVARRLHRGRDFGVRLQALEQALFGLERVDDIPSAQVAQAYLAWLRGGDSAPVRAVLDHNVQDVLTMVGLVALYGRPPAESRLQGKELVAAARTATKAKALARAKEVLDAAEGRGLESGFAREFHLAKAALCKHEAAWSSAASSLEEARTWLDDEAVRLDLAKLYEHRLRDARAALEVAEQGTGEGAEGSEKRTRRLARKAAGKAQTKLPGIE
jgi:uncharacterized protein YprB with RNaseH-like and TPR domain